MRLPAADRATSRSPARRTRLATASCGEGPLFGELRGLLREGRVRGASASATIARLPAKVGLADAEPLAAGIQAAAEHGTAVTQALRAQARALRDRPRLELVEAAALQTTIVAENWSGPVRVRAGLDGRVLNANVATDRMLANRHLVPVQPRGPAPPRSCSRPRPAGHARGSPGSRRPTPR